ncbi:helix-turn-helix transcriptional regulator [Nonomuraea sp. NPDC023979]|uniref:helix-turn-helix domain-containing protein n=1 Tax=Nonomuraea sp. NPDC023979 TaxID=3154796 RepID=UPI003401A82E
MSEAPEPPPEAKLIRLARKAKGLSPEEAAPLTRGLIGASRWRQIENGYAVRSGERIPTTATPKVLARMAFVVDVTPDRLRGIQCDEAAEILDEIIYQERGQKPAQPAPEPAPEPADAQLRHLLDLWMQLSPVERRAAIGVLEEMVSESTETVSKPDQGLERRTG